jgi:hypothetical protein
MNISTKLNNRKNDEQKDAARKFQLLVHETLNPKEQTLRLDQEQLSKVATQMAGENALGDKNNNILRGISNLVGSKTIQNTPEVALSGKTQGLSGREQETISKSNKNDQRVL